MHLRVRAFEDEPHTKNFSRASRNVTASETASEIARKPRDPCLGPELRLDGRNTTPSTLPVHTRLPMLSLRPLKQTSHWVTGLRKAVLGTFTSSAKAAMNFPPSNFSRSCKKTQEDCSRLGRLRVALLHRTCCSVRERAVRKFTKNYAKKAPRRIQRGHTEETPRDTERIAVSMSHSKSQSVAILMESQSRSLHLPGTPSDSSTFISTRRTYIIGA